MQLPRWHRPPGGERRGKFARDMHARSSSPPMNSMKALLLQASSLGCRCRQLRLSHRVGILLSFEAADPGGGAGVQWCEEESRQEWGSEQSQFNPPASDQTSTWPELGVTFAAAPGGKITAGATEAVEVMFNLHAVQGYAMRVGMAGFRLHR